MVERLDAIARRLALDSVPPLPGRPELQDPEWVPTPV